MFSLAFLGSVLANMNTDSGTNAAASALAAFGLVWVLVCIGAIILSLVINWRIAEKAGFSGVASLLMLIPLVNIFVVLYFAFTEWPIEAQLRAARTGR